MGIYKFDIEDARRFASEQRIQTRIRGSELHFKECPYCKNKTDDKNTFAINLDTGQFKCLRASCGAKGNMLTLAHDFGFSLGRDVDEYYNRQRRYRDLSKYSKPLTKEPAVKYMESRGISKTITEMFGITTQTDHDNIIVFPFIDDAGKMQFVKYRKTDFDKTRDQNKEWCESNCKPILFGMDHCNPEESEVLVMTEGQIDSLSVAEAFDGEINVVSVPTGAKGFTWVPYCWDFLSKFKELIVFGDHEKEQITLLDDMKHRFHGKVKHVRPEDYRDCKDANDLLRRYGKEAVVEAVENAVPVEDVHIKEVADIRRQNTADMEKISSGIAQADEILGGFYLGQLIIITGERGFGKSTLASQFMTRALEQGYKVFAYSGELVDFMFQEWVERQMAGAEYINARRHDNGFCDYRIDCRYQGEIENWYRGRFYFYDSAAVADESEDLCETVKKAFMQFGCRVIFIDNLMTALEDDMASDLYRQQSRFVRKLAEMTKQLNILIFLIVHPRKTAGTGDYFQNNDVAGSSNITNLADTIMNYTKPREDEKHPDPDPADRLLQITKNRLNGRTNFTGIKLWYEESSKRISEAYGKFDWQLGWEKPDEFKPVEDDFVMPFGEENDGQTEKTH